MNKLDGLLAERYEPLNDVNAIVSIEIGKLDHLQATLKGDIEALTELRAEVCERAEKLSQSLDLNRKSNETVMAK